MKEDFLEESEVCLSRADVLILGAHLEELAERLLTENDKNKPLVQALWNLEAALEKIDADAFRGDYETLLAQASKIYREYFDVDQSD
ncbi:hypothetical protein [Shimia sp. Alg240-R146]|uniref:hypothetical protein n=1 Tax=Shimia sp. Alg240-R146 TaxID=2993449 RepID=UPI0022E6BCCF|nr:hypothetical protein [Shimia sp. Alg240-R146]